MRPLSPVLLSLVAALATARLPAQSASPSPVSATDASVSAPAAPTAGLPASSSPVSESAASGASASRAPRAMSAGIAAHLAEKLPKFTPPGPVAGTAGSPVLKVASSEPREADKPRNTIIRLDPYQVLEAKPPAFKEREILTPRGRLDVALKRYPGLKFGNLWIFNNYGLALAMYEEDLALERAKELMELSSLASLPSERAAVQRELSDLQVNSRH